MPRGGIKENADDFVLDEAQPFGATTAVPVLQEHGLRLFARGNQFGLQELGYAGAKNILAPGMLACQRVDCSRNPCALVTVIGLGPDLADDIIHLSIR